MKMTLKTPIRNEDIESLTAGDIIYLDGTLVTCRDVGHRRFIEYGMDLPVGLSGMAIFHAGPIVRKAAEGWEMVGKIDLFSLFFTSNEGGKQEI